MTQYANLKDYFQKEQFNLISNAISDYMKNGKPINNLVIHSLVCTDDDANFNAEFELGVSVSVDDDENTDSRSFIIAVKGNLQKRFNDIQSVRVKKVNSNEFPEDNLLSQFILPDIPVEELERIGNQLYSYYKEIAGFEEVHLSIEKLLKIEPIFFSELPNGCLGRIILLESDVEIFHNNTKKLYHALPGTILLNKEKYYDEQDGGILITIAHELVHWQLHQRFFMLLTLLGEETVDLKSETQPIILDKSMTAVQKALCIAEWQANAVAMRLAIPSSTVDATIKEIANDPSTYYENFGDRMQACVIKFAKKYNVSSFIAKERLYQLGYDFVNGTIVEFDNDKKKPFYFTPGTLNSNETFVIDQANYERLLRENEKFAELIESRRYVYLGYVVCLFDAKYICVEKKEDGIKLVLSDYAREHADECLLKFQFRSESDSNLILHYGASYLNKIPEYNKIVPESFELCEEDTELDPTTISQIKEYNDTLTRLNSPELSTLANTIVYYMKEKEIDDKELHKRIGLSIAAIEKIYTGKTEKVNIKNVMALCIGLQLDSEECYDMFEKAGYNIREDTLRNRAYRYLFNNAFLGLKECNKILRYFNQEELPDHKKKLCETEK